jgi:hypothetical protein
MPPDAIDLKFPAAGLDVTQPYGKPQPRALGDGVYARTTRVGTNVRAYEATQDRRRGGSRPGLARYVPAPVVSGWVVQHLDVVAFNP